MICEPDPIRLMATRLLSSSSIELKDILDLQLRDNRKARIQDEEESNTYITNREGKPALRSQYAIYDFLKNKHS
ncbi:MAG TPA: hypothetical protein ENH91_13440 [Leeuwenhoekiella sp.]|nr:hypothetical protein [Leeuwenhoekiella sp.]